MVDDVRAWLAERGVPGVTGAETSAILSTLPRAHSALCRTGGRRGTPRVRPLRHGGARAIHRAEWMNTRRHTAHNDHAVARARDGCGALNARTRHLTDADAEQLEAPADDVPADVLAKIAGKGSVGDPQLRGTHAAEAHVACVGEGVRGAGWSRSRRRMTRDDDAAHGRRDGEGVISEGARSHRHAGLDRRRGALA